MSIQKTINVTCPECKKEHPFEIWASVNTVFNPELKEKVLNGELFTIQCPDCGAKALISYPFLYHQMEDFLMIQVGQSEVEKSNIDILKNYIYRNVASYDELCEKILIFDDKLDDCVIEIIKAIMVFQMQTEKPELEVNRVFYAHSDDQTPFFVLLHNGQAVAAMKFDQELYDKIETNFHEKIEIAVQDTTVIDHQWAFDILVDYSNSSQS